MPEALERTLRENKVYYIDAYNTGQAFENSKMVWNTLMVSL
jgi:hypothetical protein